MLLMRRAHTLLDKLGDMPGLHQWLSSRYDRRFADNTSENLFRGVFTTFEEAAASAPRTRPIGYDNPDSALMYRDRLKHLFPTDYPVLFWLQHLFGQGQVRIFELGGHIGVSYYAYQSVLTYPPNLQWVIHDVPAVMERGAALARNRDDLGKLQFVDDFSEAARADIFLAMGVLQYLPQTLADRLQDLKCLPQNLLVNLTPLHPDAAYFTLQSIGTAYCPYRIDREDAFIKSLQALGYALRDAWINPDKSCLIPFSHGRSLNAYHGYHFALTQQ